MANNVPSDHVPLQGQNIYNDPPYQNLFSSVDRYGTPSWDTQLSQHSGLAPANASTQAWHQGNYPQQPYNAYSQSYGTQGNGFQTTSPSPYQYGQFPQQGSMPTYAQPSNVDPSLGLDPVTLRQQQQSPYTMPVRNATPQSHSGTVTPQALQHTAAPVQNVRPAVSPFQVPRTTTEMFTPRPISTPNVKPVPVPSYEIPKGKKSGGLYVLDQSALAKATKSTTLNKLVTFGSEPFHLSTNRTALPLYTARQSVKELKRIGADNKKLLAKLSASKSSTARAFKARTHAGSPSALKREVSDSESYTESSDDDSEYSDDDDEDEVSPLPAARPEEPHEAVRYDIIKATWHPRRSPLNSEKIKDSLRDIWEVLNTIQKRWRADSKAVTDAEDQKKTGELPVLKSRVASQRDLLQSALKAALEYAHPDVVYQLGKIKPFMYLCYQFLANRFHSKDFDGALPTVIYEILTKCGTLTSELLEETKVIKALTSMKKQANDKHKAYIQQIVDGAAANSKKTQAGTPPVVEATESKNAKRPAPELVNRTSNDAPAAKKPKPAEVSANVAKKPLGTVANSKPTASATAPVQRKPATAPALVKARVSQVTNKPSGLFASLNAASKKPTPAAPAPAATKSGAQSRPSAAVSKDKKPATAAPKPAFSFAQTMASLLKPKEPEPAPVKSSEKQLPPETPEEKAKRLRKEARRHLRVTFKPDTALVQIKYFSHDPEEELGHDENFVRDAGDIGGEGRMFKQHKELDVDDDDEDEPDLETNPWKEPSPVDFSLVISSARESNFAPYGGGQQIPSCPEKEANVRRENATLMVFYADPKDIPSSPREPLEQDQESAPAVTVKNFGMPPDTVLAKAPQSTTAASAAALPDLSSLENIFKQFAMPTTNQSPAVAQPAPVPQPTYAPPQMPAGMPDLQSILSALQGPATTQVPATNSFPPQAPAQIFPPPPPAMDFNAIMSAISAQAGSGMALPPPPPGFPPFPMPFPMPAQQQDNAVYQAPQQTPYNPQDYNAQPNGGTKRQRDDGGNSDRGSGKKHKNRGERPHKVLPCKFFQKGTCMKGDNCTYVHDLNM
ncbi:hypothetical protein DE146DRAFT_51633 [Phaeosphaeria sp. MPI-PUGE-AT-0046c]|nr:hypothetical protein DE146DRAFT_51633 [Phaeosphaeria sp. MPI-PUGE-AT-0046c]